MSRFGDHEPKLDPARQHLADPGARYLRRVAFSVRFTPTTTDTHAVLWNHGLIQDLGTLGGPDSTAAVINVRGEVAGYSYTSVRPPNASSGTPTIDAFHGTREGGMVNIGDSVERSIRRSG